jgi:glycosyltransferase involved in cell wall biosynthesis
MKIAVVHDWLVTFAGAEAVLEQILGLFPEAELFSMIDFLPHDMRARLLGKKARTSFVQGLPFAEQKYRSYFPVMPWAAGRFDLSGYDLIISSSHSVAKGVSAPAGCPHICYSHTPMRYAWDLKDLYLKAAGFNEGIARFFMEILLRHMRNWDVSTAKNVSHFIASSRYIAGRIRRCYGKDSTVIYPPVDTEFFTAGKEKADYYVTVSRLVPYKRVDLIAEAFSEMPDKRLVIIGDGPESDKVRSRASAGNIKLLGYQPREVLKGYLQGAKAFVLAAEEDFGILPVEAQACGTPVIAYRAGGALETVIEGKTGVFFEDQTTKSLKDAIARLEESNGSFDPGLIRRNAERFCTERFRKEFSAFMEQATGKTGIR